jgi:TfoX/Sxy family transcriptional regulator of competence genes
VTQTAFEKVANEFAGRPHVTSGAMMASPGLKVGGKIFAMLTRDRFVVKLPKARVDELIAQSSGTRFDPGHGRLMKEWIVVNLPPRMWLALAEEAYRYVKGTTK